MGSPAHDRRRWECSPVIITHGDMVRQDNTSFVRKTFGWL